MKPRRTVSPFASSFAGLALVIAAAAAASAVTAGVEWAFPGAGPDPKPSPKPVAVVRLAGSSAHYTHAQIDSGFTAIDWWPAQHGPLPPVVRSGRPPAVMACGYCHLPTGNGRPENASLAGLPVDYMTEQVHAMRAGTRVGVEPAWAPVALMHRLAHSVSAADVSSAVGYFAKQKFVARTRVVEAAQIPAVVAASFVYRRLPGNKLESLGTRIVEVPDDFKRFELRDDRVGYVAYVPPGALARGEAMVNGGGDAQVPACMGCHGEALSGSPIAPPVAGRSPTVLFRQLIAFRTGTRRAAPMQAEVSQLTVAELIDLAAYAGSLKP